MTSAGGPQGPPAFILVDNPASSELSPHDDRDLRRCRRLPGQGRDLPRRRALRPEGLCRQQFLPRRAARPAHRAGGRERRLRRRRQLDRRAGRAGRHRRHRRHPARRPRPEGGGGGHRQHRRALHDRLDRHGDGQPRADVQPARHGRDHRRPQADEPARPLALPVGARRDDPEAAAAAALCSKPTNTETGAPLCFRQLWQ